MERTIKQKIYQAMDSFLVESEDLKGNPIIRSVETLNEDRHLFVEQMEEIIKQILEAQNEKLRKISPTGNYTAEDIIKENLDAIDEISK